MVLENGVIFYFMVSVGIFQINVVPQKIAEV
jgi:hypothetical protein